MLKLRHINPMVRAIGTMGAVAALVGGVTFAQQTSNTVMLTDNTITSSTASLQIANTACGDTAPGTTTATGMSINSLAPGGTSSPFTFCLWNAGTADLDVSVTSPTNFSTSAIPAADVTLNFTCGATTDSVLLSALGTATVVDDNPLTAASGQTCTVTATLNSSYTGTGGSVTPFELDFAGTSTTV